MRPVIGLMVILLLIISASKNFGHVATAFAVYAIVFALKTWEELK